MKKLLIIDDNKSITKMLTKLLSLEGFECVVANDGRNGLSLIENQDFDIILLDIAMPEFSGVDVVDSLEKNGKLKEKKIIILTASSVSESEINSLKTKGILNILKKPVDLDVLLSTINAFT